MPMRLVRQITAGKYVKWTVAIPKDVVLDLGWMRDEELEMEVRGGELVVRRAA